MQTVPLEVRAKCLLNLPAAENLNPGKFSRWNTLLRASTWAWTSETHFLPLAGVTQDQCSVLSSAAVLSSLLLTPEAPRIAPPWFAFLYFDFFFPTWELSRQGKPFRRHAEPILTHPSPCCHRDKGDDKCKGLTLSLRDGTVGFCPRSWHWWTKRAKPTWVQQKQLYTGLRRGSHREAKGYAEDTAAPRGQDIWTEHINTPRFPAWL